MCTLQISSFFNGTSFSRNCVIGIILLCCSTDPKKGIAGRVRTGYWLTDYRHYPDSRSIRRHVLFDADNENIGRADIDMFAIAKKCKTYVFLPLMRRVYGDPMAQLPSASCPDNLNLCGQRSCYNEGDRCASPFLITKKVAGVNFQCDFFLEILGVQYKSKLSLSLPDLTFFAFHIEVK